MAFMNVFCLILLYLVVLFCRAYAFPGSFGDKKPGNTSSCEWDWKRYDEHCYKLETTFLSWENASNHCERIGGNLASIHSEEQSVFLEYILKGSVLLAAWIGLHDHTLDLQFEWQDGTPVNYTDFYFEMELDTLIQRRYCVAMYSEKSGHVIMWNVHECSEKGTFFCQKQTNVLPKNPVNKSSKNVSSCKEDWKKYDKYCYIFIERDMNWTSAFRHCRSIGGSLTIIQSVEQNKFLEDTLRKIDKGSGSFSWLGLHDYEQDGRFEWVDGTALDSKDWNLERHIGRHERCVFMLLYTSSDVVEWNIQDCTYEEAFFCQKEIDVAPSFGSQGYISIPISISFIIGVVALLGGISFYRRRWLDRNLTEQGPVYYNSSLPDIDRY